MGRTQREATKTTLRHMQETCYILQFKHLDDFHFQSCIVRQVQLDDTQQLITYPHTVLIAPSTCNVTEQVFYPTEIFVRHRQISITKQTTF